MSQLEHVVPPRGKRKPRPVSTELPRSVREGMPGMEPASGSASSSTPGPAVPSSAMDDDDPVVTEWTANGLPQRRSRGRAPLGSHNLPQQSVAPSADPAGAHDGGRGTGEETPPGLWLEAFTQAVNGVPQEPKTGEDSDDVWDKGDLK
jgi:hypothetical protein